MKSEFNKYLLSFFVYFNFISLNSNILTGASGFWAGSSQHLRASLRHIEKGGIGYNTGYTTLDGFFSPIPTSDSIMPFLDLRGHVFDNGKLAANIGFGLRNILGCRAYGFNAYYDYRNYPRAHYNQIGFGFETLGTRWDLRVNGYFPLNNKSTPPYFSRFSEFLGNYMMLFQKYCFPMKGANAEVGAHFGHYRVVDLYGAVGTYYFTGQNQPHIWGGKVRLTCKFKKYITLELSNSYDKMFKNRFQFNITLTLPFGSGCDVSHTDYCNSFDSTDVLLARMVQPVERQEIIVVGYNNKCCPAIDPLTGRPYNFVFVDNTSSSLGTYESPYPTLLQAQANSKPRDIIYVFPGDGTTQGMDSGIILQNNQKLWGAGVSHSLATSNGNILIPSQSSTSPNLTNASGSGITLASTNEVSGFVIKNVFENGIYGVNSENIEISHSTIDNSQLDHIYLEYNNAPGTLNLNNLTLTNGQQKAIFIDAQSSNILGNINNCFIQNNERGIDASFDNQLNLNLKNNIISENQNTIDINLSGPSTLLISGNNLNNNTSVSNFPIGIVASSEPIYVNIENNIINENSCGGINFTLNDTNSAQLNINNNTLTNNASGSLASLGSAIFINPNTTTSGNCIVSLNKNTISGNGASGLYCYNGDYNSFQANVADNTFTNNGAGGLVFASSSNAFNLNANNNIISGGQDNGIAMIATTFSQAKANISNNKIINNINNANAIAVSCNSDNIDLNIINNNLSQNEGSGILSYSSSAIDNLNINIANNIINNNQNLGSNAASGVDLEQFNNLLGNFNNNTLSGNSGTAVYIGSTQPSPVACLEMSGNNSDTGYTLVDNSGTFNLTPCNVNEVNIGTITTSGTITSVQSCPAAEPCS